MKEADIDRLIEKAMEYRWKEPDKIPALHEQIFKNSQERMYQKGLIWSYIISGIYCYISADFIGSIKDYETAELLIKDLNQADIQAAQQNIHSGLGTSFMDMEQYEEAIHHFKITLEISESNNDRNIQGGMLANIGIIQAKLEKYDDALIYFNKALKIFKDSGNNGKLWIVLNNIANLHRSKGDLDLAFKYITQAYEIAQENGQTASLANMEDEMGVIAHLMGKYSEADDMHKKALMKARKYSNTRLESEILYNMATNYEKQNKTGQALEFYNQAIATSEAISFKSILRISHKAIADLYQKMRDPTKEAIHLRKWIGLEEKILDENLNSKLKNFESDSLRRSNERLRILTDMGLKLSQERDSSYIRRISFEFVSRLLDFIIFGIASLDRRSNTIRYDSYYINSELSDSFECPIDPQKDFASWCIKNKSEVIINDIEKDYVKYLIKVPQEQIGQAVIQSLLYLPLLIEDKALGLITVQSSSKNAFSSTNVESLKTLAFFIASSLSNAYLTKKIEDQNKRLKMLSAMDPLTNTLNRREFERISADIWNQINSNFYEISLLMIDADFFKNINDTYGHIAGDLCLKEIARILNNYAKRDTDFVSRFGGEEFLILLSKTGKDGAEFVAENIRKSIEALELISEGNKFSVTVSIGVTVLSDSGKIPSLDLLIKQADDALYKAKETGRNKVCFF